MKDGTDRQKRHKRNKTIFKVTGIAVLCVALGMIVTGMVDFFSAMGGAGYPERFWMLMVGLPLLAVGFTLTGLGFRREMATYIKNESVPVFNEAGKEIAPGVQSIASAVREGYEGSAQVCPVCGETNREESKFCKKCGAPLKRVCPHCGEEVASDSKFCDRCGEELG